MLCDLPGSFALRMASSIVSALGAFGTNDRVQERTSGDGVVGEGGCKSL
jgi:hypothetical protein